MTNAADPKAPITHAVTIIEQRDARIAEIRRDIERVRNAPGVNGTFGDAVVMMAAAGKCVSHADWLLSELSAALSLCPTADAKQQRWLTRDGVAITPNMRVFEDGGDGVIYEWWTVDHVIALNDGSFPHAIEHLYSTYEAARAATRAAAPSADIVAAPAKHSPLPWFVGPVVPGEVGQVGGTRIIQAKIGSDVFDVAYVHPSGADDDERDANAELIVRAVNVAAPSGGGEEDERGHDGGLA